MVRNTPSASSRFVLEIGGSPMATLNRIARLFTHEGAKATNIPPLAQLERSVLSCLLWEDEFYEGGQTIARRIAGLVKEVPAADVARVAVRAKTDMRLRHVPLLLARELLRTKEGRAAFGGVAEKVFARADDIAEFLALYWKGNKDEPLAKQAKRHVGEAFRRFDEYQLTKYSGGQKAVKLRDALRITRPKPKSPEQAELWRKLVKGELASPDTWEVELSKGGDKKASWERMLRENKLGGLALLRNLRNMREAGIDDGLVREALGRMKAEKLLPINFIAAARHNPQFEPELEGKFFACFADRPFLIALTGRDDYEALELASEAGFAVHQVDHPRAAGQHEVPPVLLERHPQGGRGLLVGHARLDELLEDGDPLGGREVDPRLVVGDRERQAIEWVRAEQLDHLHEHVGGEPVHPVGREQEQAPVPPVAGEQDVAAAVAEHHRGGLDAVRLDALEQRGQRLPLEGLGVPVGELLGPRDELPELDPDDPRLGVVGLAPLGGRRLCSHRTWLRAAFPGQRRNRPRRGEECCCREDIDPAHSVHLMDHATPVGVDAVAADELTRRLPGPPAMPATQASASPARHPYPANDHREASEAYISRQGRV